MRWWTGAERIRTAAVTAVLVAAAPLQAASDAIWTVAGRQGLVQLVIVPNDQAREKAAYDAQIGRLCEPERTCFLNFYTNTTGAPLGVPLPDAVDKEATAVFRRSAKQGAENFRWSCRMKMPLENCF
jgi:hypothetical protein